MKYYIIAGEASADLHAANLIKAIKVKDKKARFRFWGGDKMIAEVGDPVIHYKEIAFMGFWEVFKNLPKILKHLRLCKEDIISFQPDRLILVDYPGFNFRIAKFAYKQGFKTIWYIAPQVWAWKASRTKKLKAYTHKLISILPFEQQYFQKKWNYKVEYVGHPLLDEIKHFKPNPNFKSQYQVDNKKPIIALLPGSRAQEIKRMLPLFSKLVTHFPDFQFMISAMSQHSRSFYQHLMSDKQIPLVFDDTYNLLAFANAALVTSGTATLETALFKVPHIICYKGSAISYAIGKRLVNVSFIGIANLIMNKAVSKELIQDELNGNNLKQALQELFEPEHQRNITEDFNALIELLGQEGASEKAAKIILEYS